VVLPETEVSRVVGVSDEVERQLLLDQRYAVAQARTTSPLEREKTPEEIIMIKCAGENVNALRAKNGLEPIQITEDRVKMIRGNHIEGDVAHYAVALKGEGARLEAGSSALGQVEKISDAFQGAARFNAIQHELIHSGSYKAAQVLKSNGAIDVYRLGLSVANLDDTKEGGVLSGLECLNEAVTEENARRLTLDIKKDDEELGYLTEKREEEYEEMLGLHKKYPNQVDNPEPFKDDFLSCTVDYENGGLQYRKANYAKEREVMWKLFDTVYEKSPEQFDGLNRDEAREFMFQKATSAMFTGNILPLGRLVNKSLGLGSFRQYGNLQTPDEIEKFLLAHQ
jgi:hypothetical protein